MSLRRFATQVVNESHMAVKKWEDQGNNPTNMDLNIEIVLRLYILDKVVMPAKQVSKFQAEYRQLTQIIAL